MKNLHYFVAIVLAWTSIGATAQTLRWPIAGKQAGENILSQPQTYIDNELNYDNLFITGSLDDVVIAPTDGVVSLITIVHYQSLSYMYGSGCRPNRTINDELYESNSTATQIHCSGCIPNTNNCKTTAENKSYESVLLYTGCLGIKIADGNTLYLSGLCSDKLFKTGQKISAGDTLGTLHYAYKKFDKPNLRLSISNAKSKPSDPMSPFGLVSTFVEPNTLVSPDTLSVQQTREDLNVLKSAMLEAYPTIEIGLNDKQIELVIDSITNGINSPVVNRTGFKPILTKILKALSDSHLQILPDDVKRGERTIYIPTEFFMWCDDTLSILISTSGKDSLIGRPIVQIDEQSAREYAQASAYRIYYHDIGVQSTEEEELVLLGAYSASRYPEANSQTTNTITFADGTTAIMGFLELNKINRIMRINDGYKRISTWRRLNTSRNPDDVYEMRQINDSTSLLSLKTFVLNEIQLDSLLGWLRRCQSDNLIIDLRNNSGGDANVTNRLLSVFAQKPLNRQKGGYSMVKSRGHFQSFAHSLNYTQAVNSDIFPEYEAREGMEGFYLNDSLETVAAVYPDTLTQYTGKVYVLTNGNSCSAATLFPAVLVRNRRGVTVGRETRTGYHSMAALKFAQIRLPNSLYTINVPMVRCVFDTTICDRTPARRGLLPDYPLRLTRHEVMMGNDGQTDVMLDYTLSLIAQGLYLSPEDPFATADTPPTPKYPVHWGVIALVGATAILFIMLWIKRKKAKN